MTLQRLALKARSTTRHAITMLAALALVTLAPACADPQGTDDVVVQPPDDGDGDVPPAQDVDVAGLWELTFVGGEPLPASPATTALGSGMTYHSGLLEFYADGTWRSLLRVSLYGEVLPNPDQGTYEVEGNVIIFSRSECPDVRYPGELKDGVLVIAYKGYCNPSIYTVYEFVPTQG